MGAGRGVECVTHSTDVPDIGAIFVVVDGVQIWSVHARTMGRVCPGLRVVSRPRDSLFAAFSIIQISMQGLNRGNSCHRDRPCVDQHDHAARSQTGPAHHGRNSHAPRATLAACADSPAYDREDSVQGLRGEARGVHQRPAVCLGCMLDHA